MADNADLEARLLSLMADVEGDRQISVEGLMRLSGGASRETWSFDVRRLDGGLRPLILRRDPPAAPKGGMTVEAALVSAAGAAGVPVPGLVASSDDPDVLGASFMVVDRLEGETIPRRILRDPDLGAARATLAEECGRVLALLHALPPSSVPGLDTQDQVTQYRQILDSMDQASPAFELAFRWLEENRPGDAVAFPGSGSDPGSDPGSVIVHGDFRNGNLIVGPDGLRAVLDWELAHLGDPMEDLGWLCVKSWRFGVDLPVGGFGTYEQLISGYESAGGRRVDPRALLWWEVLGNLKWGVICMMQASAHTSGAIRSVELAAIGRRVCEVEWDLLSILPGHGSGPFPSPPPPAPAAAASPSGYLHGSPDAAGLVEAVREFIEGDVMAATDGRVRFHARVAANVLAMVERELSMGGPQAVAHDEALAALGVASEAQLALAIRSGSLDDRSGHVRGAVAAAVRAKLDVANPRYLEGPAGPGAEGRTP